jgi:hypothetical protein
VSSCFCDHFGHPRSGITPCCVKVTSYNHSEMCPWATILNCLWRRVWGQPSPLEQLMNPPSRILKFCCTFKEAWFYSALLFSGEERCLSVGSQYSSWHQACSISQRPSAGCSRDLPLSTWMPTLEVLEEGFLRSLPHLFPCEGSIQQNHSIHCAWMKSHATQ